MIPLDKFDVWYYQTAFGTETREWCKSAWLEAHRLGREEAKEEAAKLVDENWTLSGESLAKMIREKLK